MRASKERQIAKIAEAPKDTETGYLANWLVVCTLPHRDPKTASYTRINGDCSLSVQTGLDAKGKEIGLPYGALVRLLLFWIITEANRLKLQGDTSRRIHLGDSINRFLLMVGLDPKTGGGKRSDLKRLREQMKRLFACRITFVRDTTTAKAHSFNWLHMDIAPQGELWWDVKDPDQAALFESWIELGEKFYTAVTTSPVPFDFRALCALKHSPMAIDLYTWLTWRVHGLADGSSTIIPLHGPKGLAAQIGSQYGREDNFKAALAEGLEAVKLVWPQLACDLSPTELTVRKSPVPIADVPPQQKRRRLAGLKPDELSIDSRLWFQKTHPRIKFSTVKRAFQTFLEREQIKPHDIDALFKSYAIKWVSGEL